MPYEANYHNLRVIEPSNFEDNERKMKFVTSVLKGERTIPESHRPAIDQWAIKMLQNSNLTFVNVHLLVLVLRKTNNPIFRFFVSHVRKDDEINIKENIKDGCVCPTCDQYIRQYKRSINANMCVFLQSLYINQQNSIEAGGDGWVHHSDCEYTGRDYNQLLHWGLIATQKDSTGAKKTTGYWKVTELGVGFLTGEATVHKSILSYNGSSTIDTDSEQISFEEAFGQKFNYEELMEGV